MSLSSLPPPSSLDDTVFLTHSPLETLSVPALVSHHSAGGISIFLGTTRDEFNGHRVVSLSYESYEQMAMKELNAVVQQMRHRWSLCRVCLIHRLGVVRIGQMSVVVAASSVHRLPSIQAVEWGINEIKKRVPIWKKEVYADDGEGESYSWKQNSEYDPSALVNCSSKTE